MKETVTNGAGQEIRVKFLCTGLTPAKKHDLWLRQFPGHEPVWGRCRFLFDSDERDYDWLVVYSDLPRHPYGSERLACGRANSLLVTTEPSTIKIYGRDYARQFGWVLTSQPEWALPHPRRIYSQPALRWFYGLVGKGLMRTYDAMASEPPLHKTLDLSTVCSTKQQRHTLHSRRYRFTQELKALLPEMEIFGHGVRPMHDKAESLDPYRYHLAIENFIGEHHWTEKLADVFLGAALPFYCGCPNAADYFPAESFIPIDINDVAGAARTIRSAIEAGEYERRLPSILEARRRVLEEYNLFAVLTRLIEERHDPAAVFGRDQWLHSIREIRKHHPLAGVRHVYEKCCALVRHADNFFH